MKQQQNKNQEMSTYEQINQESLDQLWKSDTRREFINIILDTIEQIYQKSQSVNSKHQYKYEYKQFLLQNLTGQKLEFFNKLIEKKIFYDQELNDQRNKVQQQNLEKKLDQNNKIVLKKNIYQQVQDYKPQNIYQKYLLLLISTGLRKEEYKTVEIKQSEEQEKNNKAEFSKLSKKQDTRISYILRPLKELLEIQEELKKNDFGASQRTIDRNITKEINIFMNTQVLIPKDLRAIYNEICHNNYEPTRDPILFGKQNLGHSDINSTIYYQQIITEKNGEQKEEEKIEKIDKKKYQCDKCNKKYEFQASFTKHKNTCK